jgi:tetratricopeptide (TPR) repeat protein
MSQRLETLKSLIAQDPANSRFRYMLAMEAVNLGDLEGAVQVFEELLANDPDYAAAYFHGGQTLEKLRRIDAARDIYQRGIECATRIGDGHTRSELQGALDMLGG